MMFTMPAIRQGTLNFDKVESTDIIML